MTSNRLSGLALRLLQQTVIWREDERHSEVICTAPSKENEAILHAGWLHVPPFYSLFIKLQSKGIYCTNVPKVGVATQKFPDALRAPLVEPPFWSATVVVWRKIKIKTTFLEFFILLYWYNWGSKLLYHCAQEAQSTIASQQHINFTVGIIPKVTTSPNVLSYYDAASFAFVAVSAAECLLEISLTLWNRKYCQSFLHKLCDTAAIYSQLRKLS